MQLTRAGNLAGKSAAEAPPEQDCKHIPSNVSLLKGGHLWNQYDSAWPPANNAATHSVITVKLKQCSAEPIDGSSNRYVLQNRRLVMTNTRWKAKDATALVATGAPALQLKYLLPQQHQQAQQQLPKLWCWSQPHKHKHSGGCSSSTIRKKAFYSHNFNRKQHG